MPLRIGDTFAGYRVLRLLGAGGMGEVYLVEHPRLPRQEALKVLRSDFSQDESFRERFIREADLASVLRHPNIVGIHDRGEYDGKLWITMDYIDGTDLSDVLAQRYPQGMPVGHVLPIVTAVASALDYAHLKGLLHRDVKPANIIVADLDTQDPKIFLADFGIARPLDDTSGITTTNMTVGTVAYAAPEQLMGEIIDGRADQYALAATTYHLLTGSQMFSDSNPAVVISRHLNAPPPRLSDRRSDLAVFDPPLCRAASKDPHERFTRCGDLAQIMTGNSDPQLTGDRSPFAPTMSALAFSTKAANSTATTESAPEGVLPSTGVGQPMGSTSRSRIRTPLVIAATLAIAVASTGLLVWKPWNGVAGGAGADQASGLMATEPPLANTGPFTGIFTAGFGPEIQLSDRKVLNPDVASGTFDFRSMCGPTGCVAIANVIDGPIINRKIVFDKVGAEWVSVGTAPSASPAVSAGMHAGCEQGLSPETWESLIVRPASNGDFTGHYEAYNANNCNTSRTVYLKRTGDVDIASVDDPAELPARTISPAENWRGRYRYTYSKDDYTHVTDGLVRTDCLRTGERCMSYFSEAKSAEPFVFSDGRWTLHYEGPVSCGERDGPRVRIDRSAELELPYPVTTPIDVLEGRGQEEVQPGPCGAMPLSPYNLRFERLGD